LRKCQYWVISLVATMIYGVMALFFYISLSTGNIGSSGWGAFAIAILYAVLLTILLAVFIASIIITIVYITGHYKVGLAISVGILIITILSGIPATILTVIPHLIVGILGIKRC